MRGGEHLIWVCGDPASTVFKQTLPGVFGRILDEDLMLDERTFMTRPRLYMRAALPSEYLRRWAVLHDIFELPTFFEGHIPNGTPEPDMAISQPYIDQAEDDPPVADDVTLFMEAYKFVRINDEWLANPENRGVTWYRPKDGILITDAHPRNFRKHLETHVLVPIDLVVTVVPPKSSRLLACPVKVWESDSQLAKD